MLTASDILVKDKTGWKVYEVKSSTSLTETYLLDATIQYYTITNSGLDLKDISIIYIINQYEKNGPIDPKRLFTVESVKTEVLKFLSRIPNQVASLKKVLAQKEIPHMDIGSHCSSPYPCDFAGYCWKSIPEYSVFNIFNLRETKKFDLYRRNIINFIDIPDDFPLTQIIYYLHVLKRSKTKNHLIYKWLLLKVVPARIELASKV